MSLKTDAACWLNKCNNVHLGKHMGFAPLHLPGKIGKVYLFWSVKLKLDKMVADFKPGLCLRMLWEHLGTVFFIPLHEHDQRNQSFNIWSYWRLRSVCTSVQALWRCCCLFRLPSRNACIDWCFSRWTNS